MNDACTGRIASCRRGCSWPRLISCGLGLGGSVPSFPTVPLSSDALPACASSRGDGFSVRRHRPLSIRFSTNSARSTARAAPRFCRSSSRHRLALRWRVVLVLHRPRLQRAGRGVGIYDPPTPYPHVWREKAALAKEAHSPPAAPVDDGGSIHEPTSHRHRRVTPSTHARARGWSESVHYPIWLYLSSAFAWVDGAMLVEFISHEGTERRERGLTRSREGAAHWAALTE